MKKKLRTTRIPDIQLKDSLDSSMVALFSEYYSYEKNLGVGSFGYVVQAIDIETGEHLALKVKLFL